MDADAQWCRNLFATIRPGGVWGVPRSGLIFTRTDDHTLTLTAQMPWSEELAEAVAEGKDVPPDEEALQAYQRSDYECIRRHFAEAGITVTCGLCND